MIRQYTAFARKILISNFKRVHFPYKLTFAITDRCNYRCKTCNIWKRTPDNELSLKEIQQFFKASNDFSWVHLTGGEIFLRKDLLNIIEVIMSECPNLLLLNFPTNGYFTDIVVPTVEKIAALKPPKFFITVSLDGDEALNDEIRGIQGGWKAQIETFKQLHKIPGVTAALGMTLSTYNADKLENTFLAARQECEWLTYDNFHVNIFHASYYYGNHELIIPEQDKNRLVAEINRYKKLRGIKMHPISFLEHGYLKRIEQYIENKKTPLRCHALKSSCFMDPTGNIYPCANYDRLIGNIREFNYNISNVWESEECNQSQKEIWNFKCPQCWTPCEAYQSILGNLLSIN